MAENNEKNLAMILFENEKGAVSYDVAGQQVKLSYSIVRNFLTKGNGDKVSDQDLVQFIQICKFNQLNPFLNEAYLVKFGDTPAQMIVSKEALMKRAEANPAYDGLEAGLIVKRGEEILDIEGTFKTSDDVLLGGWAKVYRKDRKMPIVQRVSFAEYSKTQSTWKTMPATMIRKVAIVQALREAFPAQLGAMYTQEEQLMEDVQYIEVKDDAQQEIAREANQEEVGFAQQPTVEPAKPSATEQLAAEKKQAKIPF